MHCIGSRSNVSILIFVNVTPGVVQLCSAKSDIDRGLQSNVYFVGERPVRLGEQVPGKGHIDNQKTNFYF